MQDQGSTSRRVLVVGGGIAGFAMMRALGQRGIPAVLVDRLNGPPDVGLGLNLPGNAVRALRDLGVDEELKQRGVPVRRREYRNARNRLLFAIDEAGFWGPDAGSICALRADVLELLRSGVPASAVRWGTTVSAVSERGDQVEVSFPDTEAESYDFVVGARLENHRTPKAICHRDASQLVPGGVPPEIGKDNNGCPLQRHASCQCFGRHAVGSRHRLRELPDIQFSDHQRTSCRPTYVASTFPLWSPEESRDVVLINREGT